MQKKIVFDTTKEAAPFPVVLDMENAPFPGRYMCLDHFYTSFIQGGWKEVEFMDHQVNYLLDMGQCQCKTH